MDTVRFLTAEARRTQRIKEFSVHSLINLSVLSVSAVILILSLTMPENERKKYAAYMKRNL
jgi:hypothetical protein